MFDMAPPFIKGLYLLMMLYGHIVAGQIAENPSDAQPDFFSYGCTYCCSRIEKQSTILSGIFNTTTKMVKDIREIKVGVVVDIPAQLEKQDEALDELKTAVGTDIPSQIEQQSSELKRMKVSIDSIAIALNKHSEELLIHDARLEQQGQLLEKLNGLVTEMHASLIGPKDCSDIRALGHSTSGVYRVYPGSLAKRIQADIYCDMTTPGGSWLVFQRRKDGSVNFERTWIEYLNGFGNPSGEFWLGNELVYLLTSNGNYKLRVDMEDFNGQKRYAEYSNFSISSSADLFRLTVSGYTGDAGDSFSEHSGMQFSTKDADNDIYGASCAIQFRGAWWYTACHASNLNGLYLRGDHTTYADGVEWYAFRGYYHSLKMTEMKISAY